jgi:acyl dehydratase
VIARDYPPTPAYEVGREKVREFATALGVTDEVCHVVAAARERGHPDLVAPPTFAMVLSLAAAGQVLRDPELGLDAARVVHREQRFAHHRPIHAGDVLTVRVTVLAARSVAGADVLTTREEIRSVDGEAVCTSTTTLVVGRTS